MRNEIVKHIITIEPDYGGVFYHDEEGVCDEVDENDNIEFYDSNNKLVFRATVPGAYEWQKEFEEKTDGVESTMGTLDVDDWHRRGMAIAQELRNQLPDDYDLWYAYPFEDVENRDKQPILIYKKH